MADFDVTNSADLAKAVEHNPRVDALRALKFLEYIRKLEAAGIDVRPRYEISAPFSIRALPGAPTPAATDRDAQSGYG